MKLFKIECDVFKFDVLIISNCSYSELRLYLRKHYRCQIEERPDDHTIGTMLTFDRNPWRVIWTKDWKDKACLVHELFHLVTRVCYDLGIRIVSHDEKGNVSDEPAAYLLEFLFTQCMKLK